MSAWTWGIWIAMAAGAGVYGWIWEKVGKKGRQWLEWGLAALVAGVSLASVALHEPWRDELHAWLQAREMGVGALWKEMAYEGHFIPWYLLLWPLAHSEAPVWTMGIVSWGLNAMAVWWLARRSPLTGWEKAAAGVSCVFVYVNPVVSRCYALVPLALFGVASLWEQRDERPVAFGLWVALLANTHLYMEGTAGALFGIYAWENVLRRNDGKGWKECGPQWAGVAVMAVGGLLAVWQVLPGLWSSSVGFHKEPLLWNEMVWFFRPCIPGVGMVAAVGGLAALGAEAWRKDKGVFWVYLAGVAFMWGFAVFLYGAVVLNRALLWWPVMLFAAWALAGRERGSAWLRVLSVAMAGLAIARPDATWGDWRWDYDPLRSACRWIATRYGEEAEVWINGRDFATEPTAVYLSNAMDWRTGTKARPISWARGGYGVPPFQACSEALFRTFPDKESFLALCSLWEFSGLEQEDFTHPGVHAEKVWTRSMGPQTVGLALLRVRRWGGEWRDFGMVCYQKGDRAGAEETWKRAVAEDGGAWEAMNNLAWVALEEGRVGEAREWIDRAMAIDAARESEGARDTEAAVRKAEDRSAPDGGREPGKPAEDDEGGEG